jgi:hypothetical protein
MFNYPNVSSIGSEKARKIPIPIIANNNKRISQYIRSSKKNINSNGLDIFSVGVI